MFGQVIAQPRPQGQERADTPSDTSSHVHKINVVLRGRNRDLERQRDAYPALILGGFLGCELHPALRARSYNTRTRDDAANMHIVLRSITLLLMTAVLATSAAADCSVIDTLDGLQSVQTRIAQNPDTPLRISDMRYLRRHSANLDENVVFQAMGGNASPEEEESFLQYFSNLEALLNHASIDDPQDLERHFSNPSVRYNLDSVGQHITDMHCTADGIIATGAPDEAETQPDEAATSLIDYTYLILMIAISVVLGGFTYWFVRKRTKKTDRMVRHFSNYNADYRVGQQVENGIILDVNVKGAKLQHGPNGSLEVGSTIDVFVMNEWMPCTVAWSNNYYSGLLFQTTLDEAVVQHICEASTEAA